MLKPGNIRNALLSLFAFLLITACGQKGPLYLPGNPSEIKTEVPAKESQPEVDRTDDEDDENGQDPE
ncbi:MAG: lipoprotein [Gammaproteobacteria bacterium]|nr:lipoprotein [Gammaproteobacteria bacterium]MDH4315035.1 lipoprotein [Gammaproteobacteria bacterium]MDH5215187.1 lipoprotein [Gammaproteobacteria bacterium]MDH5500020.1 lipoprotein [Gammaproteobacteria bacterium]